MPVIIRPHESQITAYILPGGEVSQEVNHVLKMAKKYAKTMAPKRTGKLARGIQHASPAPVSRLRTKGYVTSTAKHSAWVIHGTHRIHGKPRMRVPSHRGPVRGADLPTGSVVMRKSVAGQRSNRFMQRALNMAFATYRAGG